MSYEEAESKVPYGEILDYMADEVNLKIKLFHATIADRDIDKLKAILTLSYDDTKHQTDMLNDEQIAMAAKGMRPIQGSRL